MLHIRRGLTTAQIMWKSQALNTLIRVSSGKFNRDINMPSLDWPFCKRWGSTTKWQANLTNFWTPWQSCGLQCGPPPRFAYLTLEPDGVVALVPFPLLFEVKAHAYDSKGCPIKLSNNHAERIAGLPCILQSDKKNSDNQVYIWTWSFACKEPVFPGNGSSAKKYMF